MQHFFDVVIKTCKIFEVTTIIIQQKIKYKKCKEQGNAKNEGRSIIKDETLNPKIKK